MKQFVNDTIKRIFFQVHKIGLRFKLIILPAHYYSTAPDLMELERTKKIWVNKSTMPGIKINLDNQANKLKTTCLPYKKEYEGNKAYMEGKLNGFGPGYGYIEAQALHGTIRHYKPKKILEVGSGVSTNCMLHALELNNKGKNKTAQITCIEPYPSNKLKELAKASKIKLLDKKMQEIPIQKFKELKKGDLLFIDSSHTVKPGGEVNYIILEILPILQKGVIVHFHDITFPYDYQRSVLQTFFHWTESSLLRAFLINNSKAEILFSLSQLHYDKKGVLKQIFPDYKPQSDINGLVDKKYNSSEHFPSSTYIQIK